MRVAFVNLGGMDASGTSRWMQTMASGIRAGGFEVDYFYCRQVPVIGSPYQLPPIDPSRLCWMQSRQIRLIEYHLKVVDMNRITNNWVGTNFWSLFNPARYDMVQVAKAGPMEYPFCLIEAPIIEFLSLGSGVDNGSNILWSIHCSEWQRRAWLKRGGNANRSSVISNPVFPRASEANLREKLEIPQKAIVAGFHQREDEHIMSEIPLQAFAAISNLNRHFVLMGGAHGYRQQAKALGLQNVHFLPHSGDFTEISQFLNTLDIYAHGRSDGETFGTVLAEAMMHGKPCLTHFVNGCNNAQSETISSAGHCAQNLAEYTEWFDKLFNSESLRQKFACNAIPLALKNYSEEAALKKLTTLYQALITKTSISLSGHPLVEDLDAKLQSAIKESSELLSSKCGRNLRRFSAILSHPRLSLRNIARKLYFYWIRISLIPKLRKHTYFKYD